MAIEFEEKWQRQHEPNACILAVAVVALAGFFALGGERE